MTKNPFPFTVGIVTFDKRFDRFFKPLVENIKSIYPDLEIQVCVNGNYSKPFNEEYRQDLLKFCAEHPKIYPSIWTEFRSLSKMWNTVISNSTKEHVLVLNDDLTIQPERFFEGVHDGYKKFGGKTFKINASWSHFLANRREIDEMGWFDERLLGVGCEDGDMQLRFEQNGVKPFRDVKVNGVHNCIDDNGVLEGIRKVARKYTMFNEEYYDQKLDKSKLTEEEKKEYWANRDKIGIVSTEEKALPFEKFWWDNKDKL